MRKEAYLKSSLVNRLRRSAPEVMRSLDPSCAKSTVPVSVPKLLSTRRFVTSSWGGAGIVACVCEVVEGNVNVDLADALCNSLNSNPGQAVVNGRTMDHSKGHQPGEMRGRVRGRSP